MTDFPNYLPVPINMDVAGSTRVSSRGERLHVVYVLNGASFAPDVPLFVTADFESATEDREIPLYYGNKISAQSRSFNIRWEANPGYTALVVVSSGIGGLVLETPPPVALNVGVAGATVENAAVSVTDSATLVQAANSTRKSLIVQNLSSADIFVGGASVDVDDGIKVAAGGSITLDKTTAAIYAIAAAGSNDVRVLEES